jgi:RNA polymerase sigma-70 factor (ECF subfamily)
MDLKAKFTAEALEHLDAVYRAAVALCGRTPQADDLVQTTYLKAMQKFESFSIGSNCKAWLLRILRNSWIDELRRQKTAGSQASIEQEAIELPVEGDAPGGDDWLEQFSDEQVIQALLAVPEDMRMAVLLSDVEHFTQKEIAKIMEVAVGTVKSRVSRGRAMLRRQLANHAREMGFVKE